MKTIIILFFSIICFLGKAQITGVVRNENGEKLEFATIYNFTRKTSSITNMEGFFRLNGKIGDSITIQHVTHISAGFIVTEKDDVYTLPEKSLVLPEVTVSPAHIFELFEKGLRSTFEKLADKSLSRVFYDYRFLVNNDTAHVVNLDLDVIHQKKKRFEEGDKFISYVVNNNFRLDTGRIGKALSSTYIGMPITMFKLNTIIPKNFNISKTEDAFDIIIYLNSKRAGIDSVMNLKVLISKEDSCVHEISIEHTFNMVDKKNKKIATEKDKSFHYGKYTEENGRYYLKEAIVSKSANPIGKSDHFSILYHYKAYQNGENLSRRKKGKLIPKNIFNSAEYKK
jgi:hypothetical protein